MPSATAPEPSDAFGPMPRMPRLSDRVAEAILASIRAQRLRPGDRLPSERELGEQFEVSRTVIREATRSLAARGIVDARAGVGLTVATIPASAVAESLSLFIQGRSELPYERVHEVRGTIEVSVASLAAERGTADEIAGLRRIHQQMVELQRAGEDISEADVEFHRALALMTHNELYLIMLDSIGDVLLEVRRASWKVPGEAPRTLRQHQAILDAVARHDVDAARIAMEKHLAHAYRLWKRLGRPVGRRGPAR